MSFVDDKDEAALTWLDENVLGFRKAFTTSAKFRASIVTMLPLLRMQVELMVIGALRDEDVMTLGAKYAERATRPIVLTGADAQKIRDLLDREPTTKGAVADSEEGMRRGE